MRKSYWLRGVAALALGGSAAFASAAAQELEVITVTAQKREQAVTEVPISLQVFGGEELEERNIARLEELQLSTPNFQVTETGIGTQMYIRGVGTGNDPAFEQSVAQFVDGVSYGRSRLTRAPFFDLERIEVLRGPQSVLFGKNTTAGALSLITRTPGDEAAGDIQFAYVPEFESYQIDAGADLPLSETLAARIAMRWLDADGFVSNPNRGGRDEPQREEFAIRGTLAWTPTARFDATLKVEDSTFDTTGRQIEVVRDDATAALPDGTPLTYQIALAGSGLPGAITDTEFNFVRDANSDEVSDNSLFNTTLTANYRFDWGTLTSVTGYLEYDRDELADLDFTNASILTGRVREGYEQFSQEVRLASNEEQRVSWIAGAYYQDSELNNDDITGFLSDIAALGFAPIADVGIERIYTQEAQAFAVFGQLTWNVNDRTRLIGGLRWTTEEKDATRRLTLTDSPLAFGGDLVTDPTALFIVGGPLGVALDNPGAAGHDLDQSREEDNLTPSIGVEFDVDEDLMLFANYREGFKGGGFDVRGNSTAFFEFDEETVDAWEGGFRSSLMNGRAQLNGTVYFAEYTDLQISQFDGTIGFNVGNAGATEISGVEIDGAIALTDRLSVSGALSYLDFEFTDFRRGNCHFGRTPDGDVVNGVQLCDYTGQRGRYTPDFTGYLSINYTQPITDAIDFDGALDLGYTGEHEIHDNLDPVAVQDAYTMVDLRLAAVGESWELALLGKNLADEKVLTFAANVPFASNVGANTQYAIPLQPRSWGVQAALRF